MAEDMTRDEKAASKKIRTILFAQGYKTYAFYFSHFTLVLTGRGDVTAAMRPDTAEIILNRNLLKEDDVVSMLIRHEILHWFLNHQMRAIKLLAKIYGFDESEILEDTKLTDVGKALKKKLYGTKYFQKLTDEFGNDVLDDDGNKTYVHNGHLGNWAMDWELSGFYTKRDKRLQTKGFKLLDEVTGEEQIVRGLVLENDRPEWKDLSMENLYLKLLNEQNDIKDGLIKQYTKRVHGKIVDGKFIPD